MESNNLLRDRALKRIKALLEKTETNGASIEEAKSAMTKATLLMQEYFITINDIEDLKDDPIVTDFTEIYNIKEEIGAINPLICELLDLRHFYNKERITFVGYQTDVKIGIYLYKKITSGLDQDIKDFKKSSEYQYLRMDYHGNTIRRDFISGWISKISDKVYDLLHERTRNLNDNNKGGLVLVKKDNVDKKFSEFKVRAVKPRNINVFSGGSYNAGESRADSFNLQDDLDKGDSASKSVSDGRENHG